MTAISVSTLADDAAGVRRGPELKSRIASTHRVGPRTIACDGPRSVFHFYTFTVVCDVPEPIADGASCADSAE
jgi:hypothetical protein